VYLINYFSTLNEAKAARENALEKYNLGEKFPYLHSYEASSKKKPEADDYLLKIGLSMESYSSSPQRSLLVAVLVRAIKDCLSDEDPEARDDAKKWFESKQRETLRFCFLDICDELQIKPESVCGVVSSAIEQRKSARRVVGRRLVRSGKRD
jgi:hypothetical protein